MTENVEIHLFDLETLKLSNLDILSKKKFNREYNIIKKKITISKENEKNNIQKLELKPETEEDKEKKYFSEYKFFRNFLVSSYSPNEIKFELNQAKLVIEKSKKTRNDIDTYFNPTPEDDLVFSRKIEENKENFSNKISNFDLNPYKLKILMENSKFLKNNNQNSRISFENLYKFYYEVDKPIDIYSKLVNEVMNNDNLLNLEKKLNKNFEFDHFYFEYTPEKIKNLKTSGGPTIFQDVKPRITSDDFNSKSKELYANLDPLINRFEKENKIDTIEKDLYENIYSLLLKYNFNHFFAFMYSKNEEFKIIYDGFAKNNNKSLEGLDISGISAGSDANGESSSIFNTKENNPNSNLLNSNNNKRRNSFRTFNGIDDILGHYYFDKIFFIFENLEEKIFKYLINHKDNSFNVLNIDQIKTMNIYIKNLFSKDNTNCLLFTKNKIMKIVYLRSEEFDLNYLKFHEIEESLKKLLIHRINKNIIGEKVISLLSPKEIDIFNNSQFYIFEIFNKSSVIIKDNLNNNQIINKNLDNSPGSSSINSSNFYLIRIFTENIERFEAACDSLKLFIPNKDRENKVLKKKTIESTVSNNIISSNQPISKDSDEKIKNLGVSFDINAQVKNQKEERRLSEKNNDFLDRGENYFLEKAIKIKYNKQNNHNINPSRKNYNDKANNEENTIHEKTEENEELNNIPELNTSVVVEDIDNIILKEKFFFKINGRPHNFYFVSDIKPRLEYSENSNSSVEKKIIEFGNIKDFYESNNKGNNNNKFSGIIKIYMINNNQNKNLELSTNDENNFFEFIKKLSINLRK